jgi:ABC-type transport system involved in cytochrome bd biosynthesis fused ATPase/permease subunit
VHTLLGETRVSNPDSVQYKGKVVYLNIKKPVFLRQRSIRENILFGEVMIKKRYDSIIKQVDLDLTLFKSGDLTDVKGTGKNLSNIQRRKILMARGIYASGDIYIFEGLFQQMETGVVETE